MANEIREGVNEDQTAFPFPKPLISRATQMGLIEVTFSIPLVRLPPDLDITKLTFDNRPRELTAEDKVEQKPVLSVTIVPSIEQDPERIKFAWKVLKFTKEMMVLQLEFEFAKYISFNKPDTLVIEFGDADLFITDNGI